MKRFYLAIGYLAAVVVAVWLLRSPLLQATNETDATLDTIATAIVQQDSFTAKEGISTLSQQLSEFSFLSSLLSGREGQNKLEETFLRLSQRLELGEWATAAEALSLLAHQITEIEKKQSMSFELVW